MHDVQIMCYIIIILYVCVSCGADDLPIRGFIGHLEEVSIIPHEHRTYLWTHLHFTFEYNGDQVGSN